MTMRTLRELFARDITRRIEEVIKVTQADEAAVREELQEYVATEAIKEHFKTVLRAIAEAPADPHEGIGVWISGFFGSGKSSFAKILGYTVAARKVGDRTASQLFKENVRDARISALLDSINARIPMHAVIFDVSMDSGVRPSGERITEIMYRALLRELDYAEDFDLAHLEMTLEHDGRLAAFERRFEEVFAEPWRRRRKLSHSINEASRILHDLDPRTFPSADSWARTVGKEGRADITPNLLAERAFDLAARRKPGHALIFVIDEVGQFVARSVEKMLDLQAVVQAFGVVGKNRVRARQAAAPCWIIVTSQEKLNEVVDALDAKKVEFARLQDRFPITIDLKQSDIAEVTGRRVLEKTAEARRLLEGLYEHNEGRLKTFCALERTTRNITLTKDDFVRLYPYLPYQIDLCIDIVAGLRLRRGALRHIGGSNRTIIKQTQQMLIHPRTNLAEAPVGTLVTLDRVYELLYAGNLLPTEVSHEVDSAARNLPGQEMAHKVVKAIALLEVVKDLPRTHHNLAVVLHPAVEADSVLPEVQAALAILERAQIVRDSEEGYKLLTAQEKTWETKRNGLEPKPADRNRIKRELLREIFSDAQVRTYRYKNRPFRLAVYANGEGIEPDGHIPFHILPTDDAEEFAERMREARVTSNDRKNDLLWVIQIPDDAHRLIEELYRSQEMISEHERLAAQGKLPPEDAPSLAEEKVRRDRLQRDLRARLLVALQGGVGFFRGVQSDGSALGRTLPEVLKGLLDDVVPQLYPKLEMGVRPLKGDEPEKFLAAANLGGLPQIFYEGENGLGLVTKQAGRFVPHLGAEICKEVLDYLRREHAYGNRVTGKSIEAHFQGIGYGWERDILRLVLAVLLRGGAIEVTHQGRRYRDHNDPACREPFVNQNAFRAASFAPREALDLKLLTEAARHYEEITGKEVDIEEGAIAQAFQKLAAEDRERLLPLVARMRALGLPGQDAAAEFLQTVESILQMSTDDCVKTLAGEGRSYEESQLLVTRFADATTQENVDLIQHARRVLEMHWPDLQARGPSAALTGRAKVLREGLESSTFFDALEALRLAAREIEAEHRRLYEDAHGRRARVYGAAIEDITGQPEWVALAASPDISAEQREQTLTPLRRRACTTVLLPEGSPSCSICRSSLNEIEADIAAVNGLKAGVLQSITSLTAPAERIERVRVASFLSGTLSRPEDVEAAIGRLREHLLKLLAEGARIVLE
jgi:hypothetical protein